jgi:hypothetical protein
MASVLLDTSYLISLVNQKRPNHSVAHQYYRHMLDHQLPMFLSAIVASEIAIKEPITSLPLANFRVLPFNITHAVEAARIWNALGMRDVSDSRAIVRDDVKLMGQAERESIPFILTEDASTLYKYCERLRAVGTLKLRAIKLADGFDDCAFRMDGQAGLNLGQDRSNV